MCYHKDHRSSYLTGLCFYGRIPKLLNCCFLFLFLFFFKEMRSKSSKFITIVVLGMVVVMSAIIPVHAVASGGSGKIQRRSVRLTNASKDLGLKLTKAEAAQKLYVFS